MTANDFYFCRISNVGGPYDPSIIISTNSKIKSENLVPYPNPVTSSLVFKGLKEEGFLYLYDLKGQRVHQEKTTVNEGENAILYDLTNIGAGNYILELKTCERRKSIRLFIE